MTIIALPEPEHTTASADLVDGLREQYAQAELDQDRNPTEPGFVHWLTRQHPQPVAPSRPGGPPGDGAADLYAAVDAMTAWLDRAERDRPDRLTQTLRILKVTEEAGEAAAAWIGATGQNPRKGVTHTVVDVAAELGDVVVAALVAIRSLGRDPASTIAATLAKVVDRVGQPCDLCGTRMADAYPCPSGDDGVVWVCTDIRGCDRRRAAVRRTVEVDWDTPLHPAVHATVHGPTGTGDLRAA